MKIYNAIMRAADHIDRNPGDFQFTQGIVPHACGTPGCALGWVGHFLGTRQDTYHGVAEVDLELHTERWYGHVGPTFAFYNRMEKISGGRKWMDRAEECARCLRLYAEKYHGHEKPKPAAPDWNAIAARNDIDDYARSQELVS
jgi:hypothetical protein